MKAQTERWIATSVIIASLLLVASLAMVLGKFSVSSGQRRLIVNFSSVTGININSTVKYAGAPVGRVRSIRVLPRKEQTLRERSVACIQIELELTQVLEIGNDVKVAVKQDGLLGSRYIGLIPGRPDAELLAAGTVLEGEDLVELTDLAPYAKQLLVDLQPIALRLETISASLDQSLPAMLTQMHDLLESGNDLVSIVGTPEGKEQIRKSVANLKVITDNLKVVTTQAKGITSTLGERPWRLIWGGEPNKLPTEEEILKATRALPIAPPTEKSEEKSRKHP